MSRMILSRFAARTALAVLALSLVSPAIAQTVAITGGTVAIGDGSAPIPNGTVVIQNGRIVAAGAGVAVPAGAQTIDATGKWVTPGLVAGFSRVGLMEVPGVEETNDAEADKSPYSAAIDIAPAINADVSAIAVSRAGGITRAVVSPGVGKSIFAGQGAIIDLGADMQPVMKARAFQFVEWGESGRGNGGGSRASMDLTFREMLRAAKRIAANPAAIDANATDGLMTRADAQALLPVVNGTTPLLIHAESAHDILQALDLRGEFPTLKLVLVGASEGWRVAPQIAAAKVPVIASALNDLPASFEMLAATQSNIGRMKKAGVTVAIGMINDNDGQQARYTPQYAGNLVALTKVPGASGLNWGEALAAITSAPAEAMGMGDRFGSLRAGRAGDVVLWDGDPLELTSTPVGVWIDGVQQPLESRQTRLRDRYRSLAPASLPPAYQR